MLIYCVKCRHNTENLVSKISESKNNRLVIQSKCAVCGSKKSKFIKQQEPKRLLRNLGLKTPLRKVPLLGDFLF